MSIPDAALRPLHRRPANPGDYTDMTHLPSTNAALEKVHSAMVARVANNEMPGIVTLVARDGDVHVDAIGTRAFDGSEPMRRHTPFRIASLTKPVLAAAALVLVADGK